MRRLLPALLLAAPAALPAQAGPLAARADAAVAGVMPKVIAWRRDIHEHPELSNRETRTGAMVA
jgi:amidohydrolase